MARTSPTAVAAILVDASQSSNGQGDYDGSTDLAPYIEAANDITTQVVSMASQYKSKTITSATAELIERWLSAHLYKLSDKAFSSKSTGGASASFDGQTGKGFEATLYGQTAMRLDWTRTLVNIDQGQFASVSWLGRAQDQYDDANEP